MVYFAGKKMEKVLFTSTTATSTTNTPLKENNYIC